MPEELNELWELIGKPWPDGVAYAGAQAKYALADRVVNGEIRWCYPDDGESLAPPPEGAHPDWADPATSHLMCNLAEITIGHNLDFSWAEELSDGDPGVKEVFCCVSFSMHELPKLSKANLVWMIDKLRGCSAYLKAECAMLAILAYKEGVNADR